MGRKFQNFIWGCILDSNCFGSISLFSRYVYICVKLKIKTSFQLVYFNLIFNHNLSTVTQVPLSVSAQRQWCLRENALTPIIWQKKLRQQRGRSPFEFWLCDLWKFSPQLCWELLRHTGSAVVVELMGWNLKKRKTTNTILGENYYLFAILLSLILYNFCWKYLSYAYYVPGLALTFTLHRLGTWKCTLVGGLLMCAGAVATAFATEFWHVIISYGIVQGMHRTASKWLLFYV